MKKRLLSALLIFATCLVSAHEMNKSVNSVLPGIDKNAFVVSGKPQNDDAIKTLIKHTSVCVHKSQKCMIASNKNNVGGKMAQAVRLQSYAVQLYKAGKHKEAACSSLEARRLASEIIMETTNKEDAYASISAEEAALAGNCEAREKLLKNSHQSLKDLSNKDSDYLNPASLNNTNIDFN